VALNQLKDIGVGKGARSRLLVFSRDGRDRSMKKDANQRPSLFDFTRNRRPVVLAKTNQLRVLES
jgi:hypothetical protein